MNERQSVFDLIRLAIPFGLSHYFTSITSDTVIKLDLHQAIAMRLSKAMATRHLKLVRRCYLTR